jgi:protoporphyrinogen oxidase
MQSLTRALERELRASPEVWIRTETPITTLPAAEEAGNLVLALPAPALATLLSESDPQLADALRRIRYAPLVSATVFLPRAAFVKPPSGVGVLIPHDEEAPCLGILYNSSTFNGRVKDDPNWISLSVLFGGTAEGPRGGAEMLEKTDSEILQAIEASLKLYFTPNNAASWIVAPANVVIHRWSAAEPVYGPELLAMHAAFSRGWGAAPGRLLAGNLAGEVSIRGMIEVSRLTIRPV